METSLVHLENRRWLVRSPAGPIFFPRIDDSHCDRIHFSLTTVHFFNNGYAEKKPAAWKGYCAEYRLKELQESMDRCTGRNDIAEILFKTALNTIQSINQSNYWRKRQRMILRRVCQFIYIYSS